MAQRCGVAVWRCAARCSTSSLPSGTPSLPNASLRCVPRLLAQTSVRFRSFGLEEITRKVKTKPVKKWKKNPALESEFQEITQKALHGSIHDAIVDFQNLSKRSELPDWMPMKMSSIAASHGDWSAAKPLLDAQYLATGANERFARNASVDERQVASCVERILRRTDDGAFDAAKTFYRTLVDLRFTNVKDSALKVFIQFWIQRGDVQRAADELLNIAGFGRVKSVKVSVFLVLRAASTRPQDRHLNESVSTLLSTYVKSDSQRRWVQGCVLLAEGHPLQFAERLQAEKYSLNDADVNNICEFAERMREPTILLSLAEMSEAFDLSDKSRSTTYTALARTYAKMDNVEGLSKTWELVESDKQLSEYPAIVGKLSHFFKCLNRVPPDALHLALKAVAK